MPRTETHDLSQLLALPLQPCVTPQGAELVRAAEAHRDALLDREPWPGFIAPEVPR